MSKNWKGKKETLSVTELVTMGSNYHSQDTEQSKEDSYCSEIWREDLCAAGTQLWRRCTEVFGGV